MNWNKKDVNTKTETEQEPQNLVKEEDRQLRLLGTHTQPSWQEKGVGVARQDATAGIAHLSPAAAVATICSS